MVTASKTVPSSKMAASAKIEGYSVTHLLRLAEKTVQRKSEDSKLFDKVAEERMPKFEFDELVLGKALGRGGFCVVSEVMRFNLKPDEEESNNHEHAREKDNKDNMLNGDFSEHRIQNIIQNRGFMAKNCLRGKQQDCRYAIKRLHDATFKDAETFCNGVVDLAIEASFLAVIHHPNIIKMRATCLGTPFKKNYFILDRLYDILSQRLAKWRKQQPKGLFKVMDRGKKKVVAFWVERLVVAYDLASALKYLHEIEVMYRDIKPDNIGFDVRGDVKIFDFGLAKEFDSSKRDRNGNFRLTADTGSPRYMAAEVALGKPYNESCDVYSFSILLWQILKLETPFADFTMNMFTRSVIKGGVRPGCDPKWPKNILDLLRTGWGEPANRPSMEDICSALQEEIDRNSDEDIAAHKGNLIDSSRRSALALLGINRS